MSPIISRIFLNNILFMISVFLSTLILSLTFKYNHYSFDFTDESFYLISISDPIYYKTSMMSKFGFFYNPIYRLFDGNIAYIRQFNAALIYFLSFSLFFVFLKSILNISILNRIFLSFGFSSLSVTSLMLLNSWVSTPSYNTLLFKSITIIILGILLICNKKEYNSFNIGWIILSFGGWLSFTSKPTSAAILSFCSFIYLIIAKKININGILISLSSLMILFLIHAIIVDGSVFEYIKTYFYAAKILYLFNSHFNLFRLDELERWIISDNEIKFLILISILLFSIFVFFKSKYFSVKILSFISIISNLIFFIIYFYDENPVSNNQLFMFALFLSSALSVAYSIFEKKIKLWIMFFLFFVLIQKFFAFELFFIRFKYIFPVLSIGFFLAILIYSKKKHFPIEKDKFYLSLLCFFIPYLYAFGTGNNYWINMGMAGSFWVFSALVLLASILSIKEVVSAMVLFIVAAQGLSLWCLIGALGDPFGRPHEPLWLNTEVIDVGRPGSSLVLPEETALYIKEARTASQASGFIPGTPVIDLTGISPGLLYTIQATNIGTPWIIARGPALWAIAVFKNVPCAQIAQAWILSEPDSPFVAGPAFLESLGADIHQDYTIAATWEVRHGYKGLNKKKHLQYFLKPLRSLEQAIQACEERRRS